MPTGSPRSAGTSNDSSDRTKRMSTVEMIAGHPFGTLIVSLDASPDVLRQVIAQLSAGNNLVEQLGYVA